MKVKFTKMQAFGNDYVYIDAISQKLTDLPELARFVSNRHIGVGSDGMILICPSDTCDFRMRVFNPDGSEAEMCGNALRSTSKYVYDFGLTQKNEFTVETIGGVQHVRLTIENGVAKNITADIGEPRFLCKEIPVNYEGEEFIDIPLKVLDKEFKVSALSWGNPHIAVFVDDLDSLDVEKYGSALECMTSLFPNKTNVTFVKFIDKDNLAIREWERNCGETIGCATGCCTAAIIAMRLGMCNRDITVMQIGGPLGVKWEEDTNHVFMTGPSHIVFTSEIDTDYMKD